MKSKLSRQPSDTYFRGHQLTKRGEFVYEIAVFISMLGFVALLEILERI